MYKCLECSSLTTLPKCKECGYEFESSDGIFILTDALDMNLDDSKGDKYIGYEHIGKYYSGGWWKKDWNRINLRGKVIAEIVGEKLLLDLACGDGQTTIPAASRGCKIIAGDISMAMLKLLKKKAMNTGVDLMNVALCRMNALDIPLADESVDFLIANGVLHLISNPRKVMREMKRVLKKGGKVISFDDMPGKDWRCKNENYNELVNDFHHSYWTLMKENNVEKCLYSWKLNKSEMFNELFNGKEEKTVSYYEEFTRTFEEGFLYRFAGRGFSSQADVPEELHNSVIKTVHEKMIQKYGIDYAMTSYHGSQGDIKIKLFTK